MSDSPRTSKSGGFNRWFSGRIGFFYANWITSLGSVVALAGVALLAAALVMHVTNMFVGRDTNPYVSMVIFMLLPAMVLFGFLIVGLGVWVQKRREKAHHAGTAAVEVGGVEFVRKAMLVGFLALVSLIMFGSFGYEAYHYTDSTDFCLNVCHTVMNPEGVAYARSPHANVACVECHIGPGADWFVKAKISGIRQVFAVLGDTYERPIPAPVHALRPARDTCEDCHRPEQFHGSELIVREHTESDRANTPSVTAVVLKVGGRALPGLKATGVHWHVDPGNEVRYRAVDEKRQKIAEVIQKTPDGEVRYLADWADADGTEGEWRVMDCIDCHNRPTHIFETPARALDEAFAGGLLDADIPWLRRESERALIAVQPDDDTAAAIAAFLEAAYAADHPEDLAALRAGVADASAHLAVILERNIFPEMAIVWGTYPSHVGHMGLDGDYTEGGGCFRCHDEAHESEDGRVISQDCDACHNIVAERESDIGGLPDFVSAVLSR